MLRIATCFVFLEIVAVSEGVPPRSVNLALETVLAFDRNDNSANIKFIDDVQNFLTKVRKEVNKKSVRRNLTNPKTSQFTYFLTKLIDILKTYEDEDLEDAIAIIDDEIRKYHYKGCKFYELVTDPHMRRYVTKTLDVIKGRPAKEIRKNLDVTLKAIEDADTKQTELIDYINSLYTKVDGNEFQNILDKLQLYKSKSRRAGVDLTKLMRHGIRSMVFDHYSKLNGNTRRDFKAKLDTFWQYLNKLDEIEHNVWSMTYKEGNNEIPLNNTDIDSDNILFLKELLEPYKQGQIKTIKIKENKPEELITNEEATVESTDTDDHELDTYEKSVNIEENKLTSLEESITKEDGERTQSHSKQLKKELTKSDEERSKDSTDNDVEVQHEPEEYSSNYKDDNKIGTTPLFIDLDSIELKKHKMVNATNRKSKKKSSVRNQKMSFVTLYPERITRKLKKGHKTESTISTHKKRMHTLWREIITPINKQRTKKKSWRDTNLVAALMNAEVNVELTKVPISSGLREIRKDRNTNKPITQSKGSQRITAKDILNNDEEIKKVEAKKDATYLKSRVGTLQEKNELRFIFNLPKNTGSHPESYGSQHKKAKKGTAATAETTTLRAFKLADSSLEEESIGRSADKTTTRGLRTDPKEKPMTLESTEEEQEEEINENEHRTPNTEEMHELPTPDLQNRVDATEKDAVEYYTNSNTKDVLELTTPESINRVDATEEESVEYSQVELDQKKGIMVTKLEEELATPTYEMAEQSADPILTTVNKSVLVEQSVEESRTNILREEKIPKNLNEDEPDDVIQTKIKKPMEYKHTTASEEGISIDSYEIMKPKRKSNDNDVFLKKNETAVAANGSKGNTAIEPIHDNNKQRTGVDSTYDDQDYFSANATEASDTPLNYLSETTTDVNTTNFIIENISTKAAAKDEQVTTEDITVIKTLQIQETTKENELDYEISNNTTENPNPNDTATNNTAHVVVSLEHNLEATKTNPEASTEINFQLNNPIKEQIPNARDAPRKTEPDYDFYSHERANGIPPAPDGENRKVFERHPSSFDAQIHSDVGNLPLTTPEENNITLQSIENATNVASDTNSTQSVGNDVLGSDLTVTNDAEDWKKDANVPANIEKQMDMGLGEEDAEHLTAGDTEVQTPPVPQRKNIQIPGAMAYADDFANEFDMY